MKTVIVYYSKHHNNTKKVIDVIAKLENVKLIDAGIIKEKDLSEYDLICFASGIFYSNFHKCVIEFAKKNLPENKKVFLIYTCGIKRANYTDKIKQIVIEKNSKVLGEYACLGFDTFGPLKLIGGIAKGHPNEEEINGAVEFYSNIINKI